MKGRKPNSIEAKWMSECQDLGCIVCLDHYGVKSPAAIHHIDGKTKEGAHLLSIPLCPRHHQHADTNPKEWISRHGDGRRAFELEYGPEIELLERVKRLIGWS